MALGSSPYSKIKTRHFKQAKNTKTRYRTPFFALPFGFLFILLATIAVLKNLHPKYSPYRLDQKTCLSQLNLNFLSANTLCEHLANQLNFSDFKIQDSQTYNLPINTNSYLIAKIELPVVDFYSPLQNITADQLSDSTFLSENRIRLVSPDQLNTSTKLLSYENQYYLNTQQSGARFTLLHITLIPLLNILKSKQLMTYFPHFFPRTSQKRSFHSQKLELLPLLVVSPISLIKKIMVNSLLNTSQTFLNPKPSLISAMKLALRKAARAAIKP